MFHIHIYGSTQIQRLVLQSPQVHWQCHENAWLYLSRCLSWQGQLEPMLTSAAFLLWLEPDCTRVLPLLHYRAKMWLMLHGGNRARVLVYFSSQQEVITNTVLFKLQWVSFWQGRLLSFLHLGGSFSLHSAQGFAGAGVGVGDVGVGQEICCLNGPEVRAHSDQPRHKPILFGKQHYLHCNIYLYLGKFCQEF